MVHSATLEDAMARQGIDWKRVNTAKLTGQSKKLYSAYVGAEEAARNAAGELKNALVNEWNEKFPNGNDEGKFCSFNVINGAVMYYMAEKKAEDVGDDPFANPQRQ
jgi:hypothetical protein